jgi:integrase
MPRGLLQRPARSVITAFVDDLDKRGRGVDTRRQREGYLTEYLEWAQQTLQLDRPLRAGDLVDEELALRWLGTAAAGGTRRRFPSAGRRSESERAPSRADEAAREPLQASVPAGAARTTTLNTFSRFLGRPLNLRLPLPVDHPRLAPLEARQKLRRIADQRPTGMTEPCWQRTAALAALVVDTGLSVGALFPLRTTDIDLREATATVGEDVFELDRDTTVLLLRQWLKTHAALTGQLEGGEVKEVWITVHPGPTRRGHPTRPAALPASLRTLHVAHQELTRQLFDEPVRLGKFRAEPPSPRPAEQREPVESVA